MIFNFFTKLESKGIDCIVFKSWDDIDKLHLPIAVELDVFIPFEQKDKFINIALAEGFYHRKTTIERYTDFFYILDSNRLLMIHVAYRIITGSRFKNCPLTIENELVQSKRRVKGIRISDEGPYLYYHTIKFILLGKNKHLSVLQQSNKSDREFVDRHAKHDFRVCDSLTTSALVASNDKRLQTKLKRTFILQNILILTRGAIIHTLDRIGSRTKWISNKRGFEIAFVGVDGGGKSTLSEEMVKRFNFLGCKKSLYLGPIYNGKIKSFFSRFMIALYGKMKSIFGVVVVYDRHLFDLVAYREMNSIWSKIFRFIIPKPDYVIFCHADIQVILNRKEHDNPDLLRFVSKNYSFLVKQYDYFYKINTENNPDISFAQVLDVLDKRIRSSLI